MDVIVDTASLEALCSRLSPSPYVTVDTEFMREKTYWPRLCLVQIAGPDDSAVIDPLAPGLDLAPLLALLGDERILKVFHAARQDIEIFFHLMDRVPMPIFDTQIAAMVCGFGEQVSYETLVSQLVGARIDKTSRFTDWSQRPLSERQLAYALADVTHMRKIYEHLCMRLGRSKRESWLEEEIASLVDPSAYRLDPDSAWQRLKPRGMSARSLAVLRETAAWREREAQRRDLPRSRVVRDEALLEIAASRPKRVADLARVRALPRAVAEGPFGEGILAAVARGEALPEADCPALPDRPQLPRGIGPVVELLKVLLKSKCETHHVAAKIVASVADLERIAAGERDLPALHGWRHEVFGADALALIEGRLALAVTGRRLDMVERAPPFEQRRSGQRRA
ncbi:MAG: ribonuclease D [Alphaproteobacteria bacterium]